MVRELSMAARHHDLPDHPFDGPGPAAPSRMVTPIWVPAFRRTLRCKPEIPTPPSIGGVHVSDTTPFAL